MDQFGDESPNESIFGKLINFAYCFLPIANLEIAV